MTESPRHHCGRSSNRGLAKKSAASRQIINLHCGPLERGWWHRCIFARNVVPLSDTFKGNFVRKTTRASEDTATEIVGTTASVSPSVVADGHFLPFKKGSDGRSRPVHDYRSGKKPAFDDDRAPDTQFGSTGTTVKNVRGLDTLQLIPGMFH
jgi:hypothetical protein